VKIQNTRIRPAAVMFAALSLTCLSHLGTQPAFASTERVPKGTNIPLTIDEDITVKESNFGEDFKAKVTRDVRSNGKTIVRKDDRAKVTMRRAGDKDKCSMRMTRLEIDGRTYDVNSDVARPDQTNDKDKNTGKKTATGAAVGAGVGLITGSGVIKGAALGAGGGLVWSLVTGGGSGESKVEKGTKLTFTLKDSIRTN
jgi:hypothetical protein